MKLERRYGGGDGDPVARLGVGRCYEFMGQEIRRLCLIAAQTHLLSGLPWVCFLLGLAVLQGTGQHLNVNDTSMCDSVFGISKNGADTWCMVVSQS